MIRTVHIENFKSIESLTLALGRVTVLIGANGSGKSNILEALAFTSAAAQDKLDNEFLIARGIRVTETRFMRSAFGGERPVGDGIKLSVAGDGEVGFECELRSDEMSSYPQWRRWMSITNDGLGRKMREYLQASKVDNNDVNASADFFTNVFLMFRQAVGSLAGFLVYSPENSSLRTFQREGQILPLGINGEGLFAHLKALNTDTNRDRLEQIIQKLSLIDWFERFEIPQDLGPGERSIRIRDRYLAEGALFDQRSANEGFLFLLFYFTLFISPETPAFFAIDNIDASLNPKLCSTLLRELVALAVEHDKQVIVTTHNPAVLDGLDLHDDEQRLLVIDRDLDGHTTARRIHPPKPLDGDPPVRLSEAFLRGYIGGLPKNF
jgi:predicted ATPase